MTPDDPARPDVDPQVDIDPAVIARGEAALEVAMAQLVSRPVPPPVEVSARVMERALATPRRATLIRARPPRDHVQVSSLVVVAVLRDYVDTRIRGAAVGRIRLDVTDGGELSALTIELYVQYGVDIMATGEEVRALALAGLRGLLGEPLETTTIALSHVHVSDVTVGDPHVLDPRDE